MHLLTLPFELRLIIYNIILSDHHRLQKRTQPLNGHIRLLHVCRQIYDEAGPFMRQYVSLRNEVQVIMFLKCVNKKRANEVTWADVANDGRVLQDLQSRRIIPASQLFLVLARLTSLQTLRVFNVRDSHPYAISAPYVRYQLLFEASMYPPSACVPALQSYQLFLDPSTRVVPFETIHPSALQTLRLSGDCHLHPQFLQSSSTSDPDSSSLPALKHLSISGITSNAFDTLSFSRFLPHTSLLSFSHAQGHRLGFELRDSHLTSLLPCCTRLRKLVLLGASRLSSHALSSFLHSLPDLEYVALSIVTVNEMRENFILSMGDKVQVLKLQLTHAWYAVPLFDEERAICDALEERVLEREYPPQEVCICFHSKMMNEDGRERRWRDIAEKRRITIRVGPWEDGEET